MTAVRIQPLAASVGALAAEGMRLLARRERLEQELLEMEGRLMMAGRSGSEAATLDEQMASHRAALAALEREQKAKEDADRQAAAEAAARAARERLTGHARTMADAHEGKLEALGRAESHMVAAVAAINEALRHEAAERSAAGAMAAEMNVSTQQLQFSPTDFVRRLAGAICSALMGISVSNTVARRLGAWALPAPDPDLRAGEGWREREARHTSGSVETLLAHAEGNTAEAA